MSFADSIAVNSGFTKGMVGKVWPALVQKKELEIVYPCVDVKERKSEDDVVAAWSNLNVLLSINRFEKKKDIGLAIKAYAGLGKQGRKGVRLVVAGKFFKDYPNQKNTNWPGGYDNRVQENVTYHAELEKLAESLNLKHRTTKTIVTALNVPDDTDVLFFQNVPSALKEMLLKSAKLLIYTPSNEHFGIVPLEAMLAGVPVLAANTGGPLETVVDGKTGWLCPHDDTEKWTAVMDKVLHKMSDTEVKAIGKAGTERVKREFSDIKMAERLDGIIDSMARVERRSTREITSFFLTIAAVVLDYVYYVALGHSAPTQKLGRLRSPPFALTALCTLTWMGYFGLAYSEKKKARRAALAQRKAR
jgi:alpha-1,3/alpha-1,6-mannosyltransferase